MQYALFFTETASEHARQHTDDAPAYWGAWKDYIGMIHAAGAMVSGEGLAPPSTATIVKNGAVQDGPFPETRDELGGFVIIKADNLDAAIKIAMAAPTALPGAGQVEIRPVMNPEGL